MICIITGGLGSGKTLLMSLLGRANIDAGFRVAANYPLYGATILTTWEEVYSFDDGLWCWDEAHIDMDSREFARNIEATRWLLQTRKQSLHIIMTTQHFNQIDNRVRNVADFLILASRLGAGGSRATSYHGIDLQTGRVVKTGLLRHSPALYSLYDTKARVEPLQQLYAPRGRR